MYGIKEILKNQSVKNYIKQCRQLHLLHVVFIELLLLGFSKKSLELIRNITDFLIYKRLKKRFNKFIKEYKDCSSEMIHDHCKVIWTIWLQGMENAPDVVKRCYESMKRNITDREIIVITEENFGQYVNFPDYILEKYKEGIISKVHFSDLLRIELLATHGGTWMDGTVFCSSNPIENKQDYILDSDLFLYQTLKPGIDGKSACISSWLMTASSNNKIILLTRALLYEYWKKYDYAVDYFILHNFFQMAIDTFPEEWKKVIPVSNELPHILLLRLFETYDSKVWKGISNMNCIHKLTYKFEPEKALLDNTYYKKVLFDNQE